ncbi:hypothetical protein vseg_005832 [Gypsophila vaccaria]
MSTKTSNTKNKEEHEEVMIPIYTASDRNESPEISEFSPTTNKPPKHPTTTDSPLTRRRTFKSKTRFGDPPISLDANNLENFVNSPQFLERNPSLKPSTPRGVGDSGRSVKDKKSKNNGGPDEKEIYLKITSQLSARNRRRMTIKYLCQLFVFLSILGCLVTSSTVKKFEGKSFLGVEVWKWFVFVMVIFSGMLVTRWLVHLIVFLIEWKFLLKKNVVYFTHGLKDNVVVFVWICLVLGTWCVLQPDAKKLRVHYARRALSFITMTLASLVIGSFLWLVKTTLIKLLASSFHLNRFFERIQESVFNHYVLQTLSGRPTVEYANKITRQDTGVGQAASSTEEKKGVNWSKLHHMKKERTPSWTMKLLVDVVTNSGLSSMSDMLNEGVVEGGVELDDNEITSEEAAIAKAVSTFNNVNGDKNKSYIDRTDLNRFMIWEEVNIVYQFFEANEDGQIELKTFCKWVVKVYKDRQALQHALNDNKTAVDEFNKILIAILIVIIIILWLLLTEVVTTKLLFFFSSQLIVAAFVFGNACRTMFEAIIFVFVMHPFDVSDRCVIDGQMLVVEEMNIWNTVFLRPDNEKVYYPNSVLATKAIGNFYRSPDQGDGIEFAIDYRTPLPKIAQLKERIQQYLEQNPQQWHPTHNLVIREIENVNKIKMVLFFNHTINFQDFGEKLRRKSVLVLEIKNIFDSLGITYGLLPQEVHLGNVPTFA